MSKSTLDQKEQLETTPEQQGVAVSTGGAANQRTLRNIGLITAREYKSRVTQRSFIISTIVLLVLIVIGATVPTIIQYFASRSSGEQTRLLVVNEAGSIAKLNDNELRGFLDTQLNGAASGQPNGSATNGQQSSSHFAITVVDTGSADTISKALKDGKLDIALVIERASNQDLSFSYYTSSGQSFDSNAAQLQATAGQLSLLDKASRLGLTPEQTKSLFAQPQFTVTNIQQQQDNRSEGDKVAAYILAYAGIILIFMSVYMYGMGVAMGVAEEKGSRIMEILVNAATPFQLMAGKILGQGAAGLSQMTALVVVGISALLLQTPLKAALMGETAASFNLNITGASVTLLLLLLVYFILGFLLYATLFAAFGALVRRQDEVQNAVQPLTWLFMIGYLVSFIGLASPDATWIRIISYIPFWTPTTMLMRIGAGVAQWWEILLTIGLMIIAIMLCAWIAARIYRLAILQYGQKPNLGTLMKLVRMK